MPNDQHSSSADQADRTPAADRNRQQSEAARVAGDAQGGRDRYRDNDDERGVLAGDDRNEVRSDTKSEARGSAREDVGNNARGTDAHPTGPSGNDKTRSRSDLPDAFDDDLKHDNQRGREASGMEQLAHDTRAGMAGSPDAHGDFGHQGVQHARRGQAESPAERTHNEPPKHQEGHH